MVSEAGGGVMGELDRGGCGCDGRFEERFEECFRGDSESDDGELPLGAPRGGVECFAPMCFVFGAPPLPLPLLPLPTGLLAVAVTIASSFASAVSFATVASSGSPPAGRRRRRSRPMLGEGEQGRQWPVVETGLWIG